MSHRARASTLMTTIAFDIEVAGLPWEEVDAPTQTYLLERVTEPEAREGVPHRLALYPGLGKVIAIGMWLVEEDRGLILLEGADEESDHWKRCPEAKLIRGDESRLLGEFWKIASWRKRGERQPRLVSYNGRGYDGPILMIRSAQLGVRARRQLVPYRYDLSEHCDLADVLTFHGASREVYKLDYWCRRFGIDSPKADIDGSQVGDAYRAGRIDDIGEYCLRDVRATAELYRKLADTVIPLFRGGAD
jgi:hypothetical protein